jgi:hypothetical protein
MKAGLRNRMCFCVYMLCTSLPLINFQMPEPVFMKLGVYIMAPEPFSAAYVMKPSHQSVCLYVYTHLVARPRIGKNVTAATNRQATIEQLFDALFSVRHMSYQRRVCGPVRVLCMCSVITFLRQRRVVGGVLVNAVLLYQRKTGD